jgi:hypothetical protein
VPKKKMESFGCEVRYQKKPFPIFIANDEKKPSSPPAKKFTGPSKSAEYVLRNL